jgi:hypothetical protein
MVSPEVSLADGVSPASLPDKAVGAERLQDRDALLAIMKDGCLHKAPAAARVRGVRSELASERSTRTVREMNWPPAAGRCGRCGLIRYR